MSKSALGQSADNSPTIVVDARDVVASLARQRPSLVCGELFAEVIRRRALRDELTAVLERWRPEERVSVLVDIIVDIEAAKKKPRRRAKSPTARRSPSLHLGKGAAVIDELRANPRMPLAELSKAIYGNSDKRAICNTRSLLSALPSDGRVSRVGSGKPPARGSA